VTLPIGTVSPRPPSASELAAVVRSAKEPTAAGQRCVVQLLDRLPKPDWPRLVRALHENDAHPWNQQLALTLAWKMAGSRSVVAEAGSRAVLKTWFASCRFDWPGCPPLAEVVTRWTPPVVTLFRGGRGDPAKLAEEYSWTTLKPIEAIYGCASPYPHPGADGRPVIIRREAPRDHIALSWLVGDCEHVLLDSGPWVVDTQDADELATLYQEGRGLERQHREERAAFVKRWIDFLATLSPGDVA
jgi:hypothetical protein